MLAGVFIQWRWMMTRLKNDKKRSSIKIKLLQNNVMIHTNSELYFKSSEATVRSRPKTLITENLSQSQSCGLNVHILKVGTPWSVMRHRRTCDGETVEQPSIIVFYCVHNIFFIAYFVIGVCCFIFPVLADWMQPLQKRTWREALTLVGYPSLYSFFFLSLLTIIIWLNRVKQELMLFKWVIGKRGKMCYS